MNFHLIYHGHIPVLLKRFEMAVYQISKFANRIIRLVYMFSESIKYLFGFIAEELNQNIILVFEIEVDGAVGNTRGLCNLGNGGLKKTLFGKYFDSRL